jgi:hypothetical protein
MRMSGAEGAEKTDLTQSAQSGEDENGAGHPPSSVAFEPKEGDRRHFFSAASAISARDPSSRRSRRATSVVAFQK